jgi:cysteine desulfurase/selenocysteine lyase
VPDHALVAAPGYDGRAGSQLLGVPEAHAAALPASMPVPSSGGGPVPAAPYYFLDVSNGLPAGRPAAGDFILPADDRVSAQSFGLPGGEALRAQLGGATAAPPAVPLAPPGNFYFVDPGNAGLGERRAGQRVPQVAASAHPAFDVHAVRRDFPILHERVNGRLLVWFDNAATTHKPQR